MTMTTRKTLEADTLQVLPCEPCKNLHFYLFDERLRPLALASVDLAMAADLIEEISRGHQSTISAETLRRKRGEQNPPAAAPVRASVQGTTSVSLASPLGRVGAAGHLSRETGEAGIKQ
jgi:hypothetical protein